MKSEQNSYNYHQVYTPKRNSKGGLITALFLAALFILSVLIVTAVYLLLDRMGNLPIEFRSENLFGIQANGEASATEDNQPGEELQLNFDPITEGELTTETIYELVVPQVVGIHVYNAQSLIGNGSGVIMSTDGYILTNEHVLDGATSANVILHGGDSHEARIIGTDPATDLAVIKIIDPPSDLSPATFGNSNDLEIGEKVLAIGSPGGLAGSIAEGIVSGPNRPKNQITGSSDDSETSLIQTTAAINPGNSGGALVNAQAQVIGVTSAKIAGLSYEGIGFAVPISEAIPILEKLIENGSVPGEARLGVTVIPVGNLDVEIPGYDHTGGLMIMEIDSYSELLFYGVEPQDIIISADETPLVNNIDLTGLIATKEIGDNIDLVIWKFKTGQLMQITASLVDSKTGENVSG